MPRLALALIALLLAAACPAPPTEVPDASTAFPADAAIAAAADASIPGLDASLAGPDAAAPGPDAGPKSSQGQGGLACTSTGVVSSGGVDYPYCVATVAGVEMKIVEPEAGGAGPLRLAVYLHGDGAGPYSSGLALKKHAPWTTPRRTLYVAARAPNACAWWLKPGYTTCDGVTPIPDDAVDTGGENAQALLSALDALRAGWDLLDSPALFGGSSGGSIFLSASFFPLHGDRFPGAYALSCGGDAPWAGSLAWDGTDPALVGATRLFFTYGDKDFVVPDVLEAVAFYQGLGLLTDVKVVPETVAQGSSHCGNVGGSYSYDQIGRVTEVWSSYLGQ
ncbi:MAG TPA: hypothetical protein VGK67_41440 [Myxococcales bacterium]|jgi:predicted esterase